MKKKGLIILLVSILLVAAITVALILLLGKNEEPELDSDGDGRPDSVDVEPEDGVDPTQEYEIKVDEFFK